MVVSATDLVAGLLVQLCGETLWISVVSSNNERLGQLPLSPVEARGPIAALYLVPRSQPSLSLCLSLGAGSSATFCWGSASLGSDTLSITTFALP